MPGYYVHCNLHSYRSGQRMHKCCKSMQCNQPIEAVVVHRLKWWILQGTLFISVQCAASITLLFAYVWDCCLHCFSNCFTAGYLLVKGPGETDEQLRRRHVTMVDILEHGVFFSVCNVVIQRLQVDQANPQNKKTRKKNKPRCHQWIQTSLEMRVRLFEW